jgi:hypothetical protein
MIIALVLGLAFIPSQSSPGMTGVTVKAVQTGDMPGIAQEAGAPDSTGAGSVKFAAYPVLGYSPETRIMGGTFAQWLVRIPSSERPSGLGLGILLSQNRQFTLNLIPEFWWAGNRYHLAGELKWQHWPDRFYGIGNDTGEDDREYYVSRISGIKLDLFRSFYSSWYGGILLEVENNNITDYDTADYAILRSGSIPGSSRSTISGAGLGLAWDSRSDVLLPGSGAYCQFRMVLFSPAMGSTYPYSKWILDLRKYWSLGHGHLLYLQVYGKFLWGREIPFRNMALLGGDKFLRGYFRGRYRDHNLFLAQAEYHSPPLWRFSLVLFAGAGDVFHSYSTLDRISIKPAGGIGLRYRIFRDRRMNIRLDAAAGKGDRGIYLGIMEAF